MTEASDHIGVAERTENANLVLGACAVILGLAVTIHAMGMPTLGGGAPGPGLFPGLVGTGMALFGAVLFILGLVRRRRLNASDGPEEASSGEGPGESPSSAPAGTVLSNRRRVLNVAVVLLGIVGYILIAETAGFILTMTALTFAITYSLGSRLWTSLLSSILITSALWLVFREFLMIQLPTGFLGEIW